MIFLEHVSVKYLTLTKLNNKIIKLSTLHRKKDQAEKEGFNNNLQNVLNLAFIKSLLPLMSPRAYLWHLLCNNVDHMCRCDVLLALWA